MITYGIQDNEWAQKGYESDGTRSVKLIPVKERYLIVSMPWKRALYSINDDTLARRRPRFGIWWHKHPRGYVTCTFARWGWC